MLQGVPVTFGAPGDGPPCSRQRPFGPEAGRGPINERSWPVTISLAHRVRSALPATSRQRFHVAQQSRNLVAVLNRIGWAQSRNLYRHYGIDANAIVAAVAALTPGRPIRHEHDR